VVTTSTARHDHGETRNPRAPQKNRPVSGAPAYICGYIADEPGDELNDHFLKAFTPPDRIGTDGLTHANTRDPAVARGIRRARLERGWTRDDVVDKFGCHQSRISRIENGKRGTPPPRSRQPCSASPSPTCSPTTTPTPPRIFHI
jgi:hypothetical protein